METAFPPNIARERLRTEHTEVNDCIEKAEKRHIELFFTEENQNQCVPSLN